MGTSNTSPGPWQWSTGPAPAPRVTHNRPSNTRKALAARVRTPAAWPGRKHHKVDGVAASGTTRANRRAPVKAPQTDKAGINMVNSWRVD
jgi:hypothetical protein